MQAQAQKVQILRLRAQKAVAMLEAETQLGKVMEKKAVETQETEAKPEEITKLTT